MQNIENISTSINHIFTVDEFRKTFTKEDLDILQSGDINFCMEILKKFGFNVSNIDSCKISQIDIELTNQIPNLQGPRVNIYDKENRLVSRKLSVTPEASLYGVENYEEQIFEELDFETDDLEQFIDDNKFDSNFVENDVCSLIHMSGFEINLKKYNLYKNYKEQYEVSGDEILAVKILEARKKCYEYKEIYITKNLDSNVIKIMHGMTPYIANSERNSRSFTVNDLDGIIKITTEIANISHTYEYDHLCLEDKNIKDSFMDIVTSSLKSYKRFISSKRGYIINNQIIKQTTYALLLDYLLNSEIDSNEKLMFKVKVVGTEQILIENTLGKQKTLNIIA